MARPSKKAATAALKQARKDLAALPQSKSETPEFSRRNNAVIEAEKNVSWWRR